MTTKMANPHYLPEVRTVGMSKLTTDNHIFCMFGFLPTTWIMVTLNVLTRDRVTCQFSVCTMAFHSTAAKERSSTS